MAANGIPEFGYIVLGCIADHSQGEGSTYSSEEKIRSHSYLYLDLAKSFT